MSNKRQTDAELLKSITPPDPKPPKRRNQKRKNGNPPPPPAQQPPQQQQMQVIQMPIQNIQGCQYVLVPANMVFPSVQSQQLTENPPSEQKQKPEKKQKPKPSKKKPEQKPKDSSEPKPEIDPTVFAEKYHSDLVAAVESSKELLNELDSSFDLNTVTEEQIRTHANGRFSEDVIEFVVSTLKDD